MVVGAGAAIFALWIIFAVAGSVWGRPVIVDVETVCEGAEQRCGLFLGFGLSFLTAEALIWRRWRATQVIVRKARTQARKLVPTAEYSTVERVVGRDELCHVINEGLKDPEARRPYMLIGGIGVGKTAVIVRLTEVLAAHGAIPVPVQLGDVGDSVLDFEELARARFCQEVDAESVHRMLVAPGEVAWSSLRKQDRVVVLVDGLEQFSTAEMGERDRDYLIRRAIRKARQHKLPLVISSRPHALLRYIDATITELQPLSEEAALSYAQEGRPTTTEPVLDWVVELAEIAEAPLYLEITKQLYQCGRLGQLIGQVGERTINIRDIDRAWLRCRLLRTWTDALVDGLIRFNVALPREARRAAVEHISALAVIGLAQDTLEVRFKHLQDLSEMPSHEGNADMRSLLTAHLYNSRLHDDVVGASIWAEQLGLVEVYGDRVRFQHSVIQAYLGSRFISASLNSYNQFLSEALEASPNRELLESLVFASRDGLLLEAELESVIDSLMSIASRQMNETSLDIFATVLELDRGGWRYYRSAVAFLRRHWRDFEPQKDQGRTEAKLNLVHRLGEALRNAAEGGTDGASRQDIDEAYRDLFEVGCKEPSVDVRRAIAEQIGSGGDRAFNALLPEFVPSPKPERKTVPNSDGYELDEQDRRKTMCAWVLPALAASVSDDEEQRRANAALATWLNRANPAAPEHHEDPMPLRLEMALSQGFRAAANRRIHHFAISPSGRAMLIEQAQAFLGYSTFWYSQLTLIQALTLWALPDGQRPAGGRASARRQISHWLSSTERSGWWDRSGRSEVHPFVQAAADLCVQALASGRPERHLWIDEAAVTSKVGSDPSDPTQRRVHNLWIPPSTGWTALDHRAQQLVADVLLLLDLTERDEPAEHERYLRRANRRHLPQCLVGDRSPLGLDIAVNQAAMSIPGATCAPGCPVELCPYPAPGTGRGRASAEVFFRHQATLLGSRPTQRSDRGPAPWQRTGLPRRMRARESDLRRFWKTMADRQRFK